MVPEVCPNCGAEVPPNARACPECGSCEETGWSQRAETDHLGLPEPEEEFNYDDFVKREFGDDKPVPRGIKWYWWLVAVALVVLMMIWLFHR
jgi:uncharacterized membrane protein YvbJ